MTRDDQAILLGWLLIILGLVLATTAWWRAAVALVPLGVLVAGIQDLLKALRDGFVKAMDWTERSDEV